MKEKLDFTSMFTIDAVSTPETSEIYSFIVAGVKLSNSPKLMNNFVMPGVEEERSLSLDVFAFKSGAFL